MALECSARALGIGALASMLASCATLSPAGSERDVTALVRARTPRAFSATRPEPEAMSRQLDALLAQPLDVDRAIEVAFLANPKLRAGITELGITQAEVALAKAPPNPHLDLALRVPASDTSAGIELEAGVIVDLLGLLRNVPKSRLAEASQAMHELEVAHATLALAAEVKARFFEHVAARRSRAIAETLVELGTAAAELAERQSAAGTMNELEQTEVMLELDEARLERARLEADEASARARLADVLGLTTRALVFSTIEDLPELPLQEVHLDALEDLASQQRLDLAARRAELVVADRRIGVAEWSVVPTAGAGVSIEREIGGPTKIGPAVALEVPLFDWNRAGIAREEAALAHAEEKLRLTEASMISEVRQLRDRLVTARSLALHHRDRLVPAKTKAVELALRHYNAMALGPYALLRARARELDARRRSIEALRDYWVVRAELERAVGSELTATSEAPPSRIGN
jgi:cobalt-zinc-cadmium efflux system outer membrane protein